MEQQQQQREALAASWLGWLEQFSPGCTAPTEGSSSNSSTGQLTSSSQISSTSIGGGGSSSSRMGSETFVPVGSSTNLQDGRGLLVAAAERSLSGRADESEGLKKQGSLLMRLFRRKENTASAESTALGGSSRGDGSSSSINIVSHDPFPTHAAASTATGQGMSSSSAVQSYRPTTSFPSLRKPANLQTSSFTHPPCKHPCSRPLSCGHPCDSKCHNGKPCPPCSIPCPVSCTHSRCSRKCAEPCPPCAERCPWRCEHQGACSLPCGAPCDRLPCNERCSRKLKCGHRCPGLCGESCLEGCCVAEKCKKKVKAQLLDQVGRTLHKITAVLTCFWEFGYGWVSSSRKKCKYGA